MTHEDQQKNIIGKLKEIRPRDAIYPGIITIFIALAVFCFILTAQFLSKNINKGFMIDERSIEETLVTVDLENYYLVAKKAWINIELPNPELISPPHPATVASEPASSPPSAPPGDTTPSPAPSPVERKQLSIQVLNSTSKQGLAGDLKNDLVHAGFVNISTGNSSTLEPITLISVKSNKVGDQLTEELKQTVSQKYDVEVIGALAEDDAFDVRIVIGLK